MSELQTGQEISAAVEIARVLGERPIAQAEIAPGLRVQSWRHDALHDETQAMADHVFMTYSGPTRRIERKRQTSWDRSVTRNTHVTLIPAGDVDRWDIDGGIEAQHIYIARDILPSLANDHDLRWSGVLTPRTAAPDPLGAQLVHALALATQAEGRANRTLVDHLAQAVLLHILQTHGHGSQPATRLRGGLTPVQLARVLELMRTRLAEPLGLEVLAQAAGLSSFHFSRAFQQTTGLSPHRYLSQLRLDRARVLLAHSDLPLTKLAAKVGYGDASYFTRTFKRQFGMTPIRYRREQWI